MKKSLVLFLSAILIPVISVQANDQEIEKLYSFVSNAFDDEEDDLVHRHIVSSVSEGGSLVSFKGGMSFAINWWYSSVPKDWEEGDQIYVTYDFASRQYKLEHAVSETVAWGDLKDHPTPVLTIKKIPIGSNHEDSGSRGELSNGYIFRSEKDQLFDLCYWEEGQPVVIFANSESVMEHEKTASDGLQTDRQRRKNS